MIVSPQQAALAWADRLYHMVAPLPQCDPSMALRKALEGYRQVERRYGPSKRTRDGIGNCLMGLGNYGEAAKVYADAQAAREARAKQRVVNRCRSALLVERVPGKGHQWVVLLGKKQRYRDQEGEMWWHSLVNLRLREAEETAHGIKWLGQERVIPDQEGAIPYCWLTVTSLAPGGSPVALTLSRGEGMQNQPVDFRFYRLNAGGLRRPIQFSSDHDLRLLPATSRRGLRLLVTPSYKNYWADVYEWKGGRFVFANQTSPDLFPLAPQNEKYTNYWLALDASARCCIAGRWKEALNFCRQALPLCQKEARGFEPNPSGWNGWRGSPIEAAKQIRLRIRWLELGDHNHALLYRPHDFDYQVPPYKLGRSKPNG